ncbi:hypothetical protein B0H67DRAFT_567572 [Lasiosphaeris hirsuta]|uniref:Uncharacterized protein n=1 Tax=Lasiosphaeris hirsuta TaxID=260670 RepID=A0AA40AYG8_9PEZI|nr:hypothetical protein B0H67DRAFT_567572 [Lasiosphaeris hirsuta]
MGVTDKMENDIITILQRRLRDVELHRLGYHRAVSDNRNKIDQRKSEIANITEAHRVTRRETLDGNATYRKNIQIIQAEQRELHERLLALNRKEQDIEARVQANDSRLRELDEQEGKNDEQLESLEREHVAYQERLARELEEWESEQRKALLRGGGAGTSLSFSPSPEIEVEELGNGSQPRRSGRKTTMNPRAVEFWQGSVVDEAGQAPTDSLCRKRTRSITNGDEEQEQQKKARRGEGDVHVAMHVDFNEIYQDGNPEYSHQIVQYPKHDGGWYILRCEEHNLHFGGNGKDALLAAGKHLDSEVHGKLGRANEGAIAKFGVRVWNCDADKAQLNNSMIKSATKSKQPETVTAPSKDGLNDNTLTRSINRGITNPIQGRVYCGKFNGGRVWTLLMLPAGDFTEVGVEGSIYQTDLVNGDLPACYQWRNGHLEWAKGFEDGGPQAHERHFPVLYFDNINIPPQGYIKLPSRGLCWAAAKELMPFDPNDPETRRAGGSLVAREYCRRAAAQMEERRWVHVFQGRPRPDRQSLSLRSTPEKEDQGVDDAPFATPSNKSRHSSPTTGHPSLSNGQLAAHIQLAKCAVEAAQHSPPEPRGSSQAHDSTLPGELAHDSTLPEELAHDSTLPGELAHDSTLPGELADETIFSSPRFDDC